MPSVVMDFIRKYVDVLDTKTISVMIEDIEREAEDETLYKRDDWFRLRDDLKEHYEATLDIILRRKESEHGNSNPESAYEIVEFKINADLYAEAGVILKRYGLTHEEAILLFIKETVRLGKIPFEYTQEDLMEAKRLSSEANIDGE